MNLEDYYIENQRSHQVEVCPNPCYCNSSNAQIEIRNKKIIDGYVEKDRKSGAESERECYGLGSEVNSKWVDEGLSEEVRNRVEKEQLSMVGNGFVLFANQKDRLDVEPEN